MKLVARRLAWLLPLVLCACAHIPTQTQMQAMAPPIEEAPPPPDLPPSSLPQTHVSMPPSKQPVAVPPEPVKEEAPKHHKTVKPTTQASAGATPAANQVAETATPAEENALGTLETPEAPDTKKQAETSIADIEHGLNTINRKLSSQETKTSMQIREFLKQARIALSGGDIEGAKTLTKKAQALLGELNQ